MVQVAERTLKEVDAIMAGGAVHIRRCGERYIAERCRRLEFL